MDLWNREIKQDPVPSASFLDLVSQYFQKGCTEKGDKKNKKKNKNKVVGMTLPDFKTYTGKKYR